MTSRARRRYGYRVSQIPWWGLPLIAVVFALIGAATAYFVTARDEIVRSRDGGKEVGRVTADAGGNYHLALPPGEYVLDIQRRPRGRVRTTPQPFTVVSGQTVRVDLDIDTGVR